MISRIWHGWTSRENADAYENLLRREILPGIHRVPGYLGAYLLRREPETEDGDVEFVTITRFESMEAVRAFAGDERSAAVVPEAARKLLTRFDQHSAHYETVLEPGDLPGQG